jgi:hypothetical protein
MSLWGSRGNFLGCLGNTTGSLKHFNKNKTETKSPSQGEVVKMAWLLLVTQRYSHTRAEGFQE